MKVIACLLFIFISCSSVLSQEQRDELDPKFVLRKSTCFTNSNTLQSIEMEYEANDLIILVSHLGKSEKKKMADRRLYNARTFLITNSFKQRTAERIIVTKGEESTDEGYLDFFVKGHLEMRIYFPKKNRELWVAPCVQDPNEKPCAGTYDRLYYPCKKK